jgi:hypothetical protein
MVCFYGIFLRVLNDELQLAFSRQFLPGDVSKSTSSQQDESCLLLWIAMRSKNDFTQHEGQYGSVL